MLLIRLLLRGSEKSRMLPIRKVSDVSRDSIIFRAFSTKFGNKIFEFV